MRRFSGDDKREKRTDIVVREISEMVVRKRRVEMAPLAVYAIAQRTAECLLRPVANPCFRIWP